VNKGNTYWRWVVVDIDVKSKGILVVLTVLGSSSKMYYTAGCFLFNVQRVAMAVF